MNIKQLSDEKEYSQKDVAYMISLALQEYAKRRNNTRAIRYALENFNADVVQAEGESKGPGKVDADTIVLSKPADPLEDTQEIKPQVEKIPPQADQPGKTIAKKRNPRKGKGLK